MKMRLLLRIAQRTGDQHAIKMVESTLDHMARGGIYDHLGGGFHRYSTDPIWLVPHFEKMLYDQAALATVYLEAYQVTQKPMLESVARGILDYVLNDMTDPQGGFYSAEDADSEGEEGTFYIWSDAELKNLLTQEEYQLAYKIFGVTSGGNFEESGKNIFHLPKEIGSIAQPLAPWPSGELPEDCRSSNLAESAASSFVRSLCLASDRVEEAPDHLCVATRDAGHGCQLPLRSRLDRS